MRRFRSLLAIALISLLLPSLATELVSGDGREQLYLPMLTAPTSQVVIAAAYIDSAISGEPDEAILLWNVGQRAQSLAGWQLATLTRRATFPLTTTLTLAPGARLWCTGDDAAFATSFGAPPACAWEHAADPATTRLEGGITLVNHGGHILLRDASGLPVDALVYGDATQPAIGWLGPAAQLYTRGVIAAAGQVWQRKRDPRTDLPLDSDQASDWAGDLADLAWGRQVRLPGWHGWDHDGLAVPQSGAATATVTVAVGPEGLYAPLAADLAGAQSSIDLSLYVLEHPGLAQIVAEAAGRGVVVRLLLEGSPPGGITDLQRWCVAHIAAAGGMVRYVAVIEGAPRGYPPRYRYAHAKFGVVDRRLAFIGTENFTLDAMPVAVEGETGGRRGYYLLTDAAPVAEGLERIFNLDWDPTHFLDLQPYAPGHPVYGDPPSDFILPQPPIYPVADAPFAVPRAVTGPARFILVSAPENALRPDAGLNALLQAAGPGDEIVMEQLYEQKHWGDGASNPIADPNLRLERVIAGARRGARVRVLLDGYFDDEEAARSNQATVDYLTAIASAEGLDIQARLGNPTGGGLHAKLVLVRVGGATWSAVGSLNGGEVSHKLNREVMLLTDQPAIYARLAEVFAWDWAHSQ